MFSRKRGCESITMKFEEDSRSILKESLSYIGCKAILGHLLYCNCLIGKQYCFLCTRMISRESNLTEILCQLHSVSLKELLEDASESIFETYDILKSGDRSVFLNCFIDSRKINNLLEFTNNIPDIYPLGTNHPVLIVNRFLSVGSRILLNFLFEKFMKLSEQRFIQQQMTDILVDAVQILCGQYILGILVTMVSVIYVMI